MSNVIGEGLLGCSVPPREDSELIERAARGEERACTLLYERYAATVAGLVYRLLGNDAELDDVVQTTFIVGFECIGDVRDPRALKAWFRTIAVRQANRVLAGRYKRRSLKEQWALTTPMTSDPTDSERVTALYRALSDIPPRYRVPWVLHHVEGETLPEVARLCGTSLTSVKRRILEAKRRLERRGA